MSTHPLRRALPRSLAVRRGRSAAFFVAAFVVASVATAGSLYYSEVMNLLPCELCWYQRIAMYPLPLILGYAALTRSSGLYRLVLPFSVTGLAASSFHSWLQLNPSANCSVGGCSTVQYEFAGVLSIPNQAGIAFTLVTLAMLGVWWTSRSA
ncbi:disulfide bond formation protein B [Natrialbaceae archaeon GCM10025810]|uniref:disulfide bond formation protein B n=1 Tax=Halovalidus salilacus TaxID=3075124 RepID=UPI00360D1C08